MWPGGGLLTKSFYMVAGGGNGTGGNETVGNSTVSHAGQLTAQQHLFVACVAVVFTVWWSRARMRA